jgi:amino acid adenylation domain-containing protein
VQSHRGAVCEVHLPAGLSAELASLSWRENATLFMTLLAAFQVLLHRSSGQDDLSVGTPIAGRNHVETEGLIGFFVNTLVLRGRLWGNPGFLEFLGRTRDNTLEVYRHQDLPFEKLVEELRPDRSLSHTPLFQVMFALQNVQRETLELADLHLSSVRLETGIAKFDLLLTLAETRAGITGTLEHSTDLFDRTTVERLLAHFEQLLWGVVRNPDGRISSLPLLSEGERQQALVEWNDSGYAHAEDQCLHWLFEAAAERTPESVAVQFGSSWLSYRELEEQSNQVAHALRRRGVGPEVLVGLGLERSLELVVGLYGILKSGGAYVPLDPEYPRERLSYMLEDAKVAVVLTQERFRELFASNGVEALCLDADWEAISRASRSRPASGVVGDNVAYVMYTSGSTGRPKGVMIRHAGITSHMQWMQRDFPMGPSDCVIQKTPISFDASVWEFYASLFAGGRLLMARPGSHRDPGELAREMARGRVTTLQVVPSLLRAFLEEPEASGCRDLRWLICGGEALGGDLVQRFSERLPGELVNVYGPTEGSITASYWFCRPEEDSVGGVTLGRPIANVQIHLLDRWQEPVPLGVAGELYIGGVGVGRGYLRRPDLTAERFLPDPFSGVRGSRMYRTGDRVRRLSDGRLEFLGRVDHQVKVRGFRIELGEIESVLGQHPLVREGVVMVREEASGDRRLVGYVVAREEGVEEVLLVHLRSHLPDYMVPSVLVELKSMPLNPSGKVDRSALPAPDLSRRSSAGEPVEPRTSTEAEVAAIWSQVLGVEKVGVHDNFFALGGHSLLATQVVSRIRQRFGVDLALRELFETPSVANLAEAIEAALWKDGASAAAPPAETGEEGREELEL